MCVCVCVWREGGGRGRRGRDGVKGRGRMIIEKDAKNSGKFYPVSAHAGKPTIYMYMYTYTYT